LLQTLYLNDIVKFDLKKYAPANLQGHLVHTVFGNPSAVSTEIDIFRNLNLHLINNPSTAYESSFLMATKQPDGNGNT